MIHTLPCYREREREWPGEDAAGSARRTSASGRHPLGDDGAPERNAASPSHSGGPGTASSNGAGPSPYGHSSAPALPSGGGGIGVSAASAGGSGSEHSSSSSSVARVGLARAPSGRRDADGQRCGTRWAPLHLCWEKCTSPADEEVDKRMA